MHVIMNKVTLNHKEYNVSNKTERSQYWNDFINHHLLGKTVLAYSYFTEEELQAFDWDVNAHCLCIEFTDGTIIFPSQDDEGNESGYFSIRTEAQNVIMKEGMIMEAGYLSPEQCADLGIEYRAPYFRVLTLKGESVMFIAQSDRTCSRAGAIFGSDSNKEALTFPVLEI